MKKSILILLLASFAACKKTTKAPDNFLPSGTLIQAEIKTDYKFTSLKVENLTSGKVILDARRPVDSNAADLITGIIFETNKADKYKISYRFIDSLNLGTNYITPPKYVLMTVKISGYEKFNRYGKIENQADANIYSTGEFFIN